jgi:hypothetical protein
MKKIALIIPVIVICLSARSQNNNLIKPGCIIERPKVIYNRKTRKFVMWFHHELKGQGYRWTPENLADSRHIWLPVEWENEIPVLKWYPAWNINEMK